MPAWANDIANWVYFHQLWTVIYMASCFICHMVFDAVFSRKHFILGAKIILRIFQFIPVLNTLYAGICTISFIVGFFRGPAKP